VKKLIGRLFNVTVLLVLGFVVGWWSNEYLSTHQGIYSPASNEPQRSVKHRGEEAFRPGSIKSGNSPQQSNNRLQAKSKEQKLLNYEQQFRRLLDRQAFDEAMNLYDEVESASEPASKSLRKILIKQLRSYLENNRNDALMALIDVYLSTHYDDTDVLLILAQYQWRQGYPEEAARVYQLAFTYAYHIAQIERINQAFNTLIKNTDSSLSQQERWLELINFYELLDSMSLLQALSRLKLGSLYQLMGDHDSARQVLSLLLEDPQWRSKAQALLDQIEPQEQEPARAVAGVPLVQLGSHYLVDAQLNEQSDVVLMIDTGASVTSLSQHAFSGLADQRSFVLLGTRMFNTANGVTRGKVYRAENFTIGDYTLQNVDIAVLEFEQNERVDGLLGMNVLRQFRFEIDQDQQQLLLQPR
jgi:clan AA aspartic protease (TIGR02281 family)